MKLHELKPAEGSKKARRRVGRSGGSRHYILRAADYG